MQANIQEIYASMIQPLTSDEKLRLATLIAAKTRSMRNAIPLSGKATSLSFSAPGKAARPMVQTMKRLMPIWPAFTLTGWKSKTNAVSFVLMRERSIIVALTTNKHLEQEGFIR